MVVSRYHHDITDTLRDAAVELFQRQGGLQSDLIIVPCPGTFELTALCRQMAFRGDLDAVVAIGCVIEGETAHDRYLCEAVSQGLTSITVNTGVPVAFGVLTCRNIEQARARAGGDKGNKGEEAMAAAIETARSIAALRITKGGASAATATRSR
jgi:6,7-dimethyl-8-ribityllumazine synthase